MTRVPIRSLGYDVPIPGFTQAVAAAASGRILFVTVRVGSRTQGTIRLEADAEALVAAIRRALTEGGAVPDDVVRVRTCVLDLDAYATLRPTLAALWGEVFPASTLLEVVGLPGGASVQMDVIAVVPQVAG